jgi:hypothetical protein
LLKSSPNNRFTFTVSDAARLLNKAAVTLRKWDDEGFYDFPRDGNNFRSLDTSSMLELARTAYEGRRINTRRYDLIRHVLAYTQTIEEENHQ